ncbi:hypothetical protein, partial [Streptomyces avidinii]|uniref:hypothetical protein n=1 Tax=Streptomyces avidinii TaxID=1895 RepID=UPI001AE1DD57
MNSVSAKTGPSVSRIRIARQPFGKTARATRAVSSGTSPQSTPRNDTEPTPEHDDGLHNPNGVIQAVVTHTPEFANRVR